ncbi:MAG: glycosyltransferase family 9 protein [Thermorudis peleae]|nr:glycosyltransferase family 9 protein [Thermorudis peleae]
MHALLNNRSTVRRIAILRALHLGDLLLAVPAFRSLRAGFPQAEITLISLPWAESFVRRFHRYLDRFVCFEGFPGISEIAVVPERVAAFLAAQQAYGYDLVIQLHGNGQTSNPCALALGGTITAGYFVGEPPQGLTIAVPYPPYLHEIHRNLGLMRALGCPDCGDNLEFPLSDEDWAEAQTLLAPLAGRPRPWIGLHPGARPPARRWPIERFATVANGLREQFHAQLVITGSSDEMALAQELASQIRGEPLVLAGQTSLGGLAAVLASLDLFISNDTGPAHIAVAVKTPSITLFGPADVRRWAPLDRQRHPILHHPVPCSPCAYWECPIDHRCLRAISAEAVLAKAEQLLTGVQSCAS